MRNILDLSKQIREVRRLPHSLLGRNYVMRLLALMVLMLAAIQAKSQDPLRIDPAHFKVEFENDQVRVVRVHFDPHYKSAMNQVPSRVVILLTDEHIRVTFPDGTSADRHLKAGTAFWTERGQGRPENLSDLPFELIWVVPKTVPPPKPAGAATANSGKWALTSLTR